MSHNCGRCSGTGWIWVLDFSGEDVDRDLCPCQDQPEYKPQPTALPYAGTSGWSGTDTSLDRAVALDTSGRTSARQDAALRLLNEQGARGVTWQELGAALGVHHGSSSNVLSVLHKEGRIARLSEKRDRCKVYVLPDFVCGRDTEQPRARRGHSCPNCGWQVAS